MPTRDFLIKVLLHIYFVEQREAISGLLFSVITQKLPEYFFQNIYHFLIQF